MKKITIRVPDGIDDKIQKFAEADGLTVTDYLLAKAVPGYIDTILTVKKILQKIDSELQKGDTFSLKSLYKPECWNNFTPGSRISAGRSFYKAYENNLYNLKEKVEFLGKNSANLAKYRKIVRKEGVFKMNLLQKYNVNIDDIEAINVSAECPENNGLNYRVETVYIQGVSNETSTNINNDLANQGNVETLKELEDFIVQELGLPSADLIQFI